MSLYYSPAQPRQPPHNNSYVASTETSAGPSFRLTCVNVNHVTYNYLMDNATSSTVNENSYNYGNGCGGSLPCYQSLTSALQQPQENSSGYSITPGAQTRAPYTLPSSCESPMSLPAFSPPTAQYLHHQHYHHHQQQQQTFQQFSNSGNLFQEENHHAPTSGNSLEDFNIDEEFSLDLGGAASSDECDDDGNAISLYLPNLKKNC